MGNWFSCFNSNKSKNSANNQAKNDYQVDIERRTSLDYGHRKFEREG